MSARKPKVIASCHEKAEEMFQSIKGLPLQHEDLSSIPKDLCLKKEKAGHDVSTAVEESNRGRLSIHIHMQK